MDARVRSIRFPPGMRVEVIRVAQGLTSILKKHPGSNGFNALTDPSVGEGLIVSLWEGEADAEASESNPS